MGAPYVEVSSFPVLGVSRSAMPAPKAAPEIIIESFNTPYHDRQHLPE
jgi:hypothetical protein